MADPSACRDWYFRPARNAFSSQMGQGLGNMGGGMRLCYFFFLQKRRNYCGGMSWGASFLIILFQFLQYTYYVFVVLSGDAFALFH